MAVLQPDGGFLIPEKCIDAHVALGRTHGASVVDNQRVLGWERSGSEIAVRTDQATFRASRVVITAGAWEADLLPHLRKFLQPERQVLGWFGLRRPELFTPERFPVFNVWVPEGRFYGFPAFGIPGFKFGRWHHREETVEPDALDRTIHHQDRELLHAFAKRYFPDGAGPGIQFKPCMFTNTPDEHFIIEPHPEDPGVVYASTCSGHGYKFCSVIGEILADLALEGSTRHSIGMFRSSRFETGSGIRDSGFGTL
jgi:sarcosine oxidase